MEGAAGPGAEDVDDRGVFVLLVDVEGVFWGGWGVGDLVVGNVG